MPKPTPKAFSLRQLWPRLAIVLFTLSTIVATVTLLRHLVEHRYAWPPTAPRVVLINAPDWIKDAERQEILDTARPVGIHSVFDQKLLEDTAKSLSASPWIKQVKQVRRTYVHWPGDTLEVDCVYRVPTALVQWKDYYWLVDGDGFVLPAQYTRAQLPRVMTAPDGRLTLRVIQGVNRPPVRSGKLWPGDDLAGGLEMVKLLATRPFAEELPVVDVTNFAGRQDEQAAQIVLLTRYNTKVRWGRPPSARDYFVEVPASQKLQSLADIYNQMHRVDAGQPWIDIRFDQVTYPSPLPAAAESGPGRATAGAAN